MKLSLIRFTLALLLCAAGAYAGSMTFNLSGMLDDGAALSGTFTLNEITGTVTAVDLVLTAPNAGTFNVVDGQGPDGSDYDFGAAITYGEYPSITILLPVSTLVGYDGGPVCNLNALCLGYETSGLLTNSDDNGDTAHALTSGIATPEGVTATPEPASLGLVGLLGLGLVCLVARRPAR